MKLLPSKLNSKRRLKQSDRWAADNLLVQTNSPVDALRMTEC
jgi:hypothetical protein